MTDLPDFSSLQQLQHDVFLSYSGVDDTVAHHFYDMLGEDIKLFFAPIDIPHDVQEQAQFQFANLLMDGVERSGHFLGLLSRAYVESAWCQLEMHGFFNLLKNDRARRMWLFEVEPCLDAVSAPLRGMIFDGDETVLINAIQREVVAGRRPRGYDFGKLPPKCLRQLALRELYRPPRPAPWGFESQSVGLPGAPPYDVYEALVREYMVQILRDSNRDLGRLSFAMDGVDERYSYLSNRARKDAEFFISRKVDPFADVKPYSEICVELMLLMGKHGENENDLRALAECRSYMGLDSFKEAISISERAVADSAAASNYRRIRARSHYGLRRYVQTINIITGDTGELFWEDYLMLAAAHAQLGDSALAQEAAASALALEPGFNLFDERIETRREDDNEIEHWLEGLKKAGLPPEGSSRH